jgi:hypothetical protein
MSANPIAIAENSVTPTVDGATKILVCLPSLRDDVFATTLQSIETAFPSERLSVASTAQPAAEQYPALEFITYKTERAGTGWILTTGDYAAAGAMAAEHNVEVVLLLSDGDVARNPAVLKELVNSIRDKKVDLALPRFRLGPSDGLVNSALLYPLTRALFGADIHSPLPPDAALSARMAQRIASSRQRITPAQGPSFLWPVAEAAIAGYSVREVDAADCHPPTPSDGDFNTLFSSVAGSLFADIEAKATFWQRARATPAWNIAPMPPVAPTEVSAEVQSMIDSFHLAEANLQEIWSLVLPPQTRLELKRLSQLPSAAFAMTPSLWARIVYDFVLAFHLRTLNRGHLLGAMTPLYLAWVAGHLRTSQLDPALSSLSLEHAAAAFQTEKAYLVSRWRWPDRFNP